MEPPAQTQPRSPRESLRGHIPPTRKGIDRAAVELRDLRDDVRRRAEAIEAEIDRDAIASRRLNLLCVSRSAILVEKTLQSHRPLPAEGRESG